MIYLAAWMNLDNSKWNTSHREGHMVQNCSRVKCVEWKIHYPPFISVALIKHTDRTTLRKVGLFYLIISGSSLFYLPNFLKFHTVFSWLDCQIKTRISKGKVNCCIKFPTFGNIKSTTSVKMCQPPKKSKSHDCIAVLGGGSRCKAWHKGIEKAKLP